MVQPQPPAERPQKQAPKSPSHLVVHCCNFIPNASKLRGFPDHGLPVAFFVPAKHLGFLLVVEKSIRSYQNCNPFLRTKKLVKRDFNSCLAVICFPKESTCMSHLRVSHASLEAPISKFDTSLITQTSYNILPRCFHPTRQLSSTKRKGTVTPLNFPSFQVSPIKCHEWRSRRPSYHDCLCDCNPRGHR